MRAMAAWRARPSDTSTPGEPALPPINPMTRLHAGRRPTDAPSVDEAAVGGPDEPPLSAVLELARILREAGWAPALPPGSPTGCDPWPVGIPAACLALDDRFLLRLRFPVSDAGPEATTQAVAVAGAFTREGGHLVELARESDHARLLVVPTVRQAMAVLVEHRMPVSTLESWLRVSGVTGDVKQRIEQLVDEIAREAAELESQLVDAMGPLPLPEVGSEYVH